MISTKYHTKILQIMLKENHLTNQYMIQQNFKM